MFSYQTCYYCTVVYGSVGDGAGTGASAGASAGRLGVLYGGSESS